MAAVPRAGATGLSIEAGSTRTLEDVGIVDGESLTAGHYFATGARLREQLHAG